MCVILYKPSGVKMPSRKDLKACFETNPHGAGYMLPINDKVVIRKGFMTYEDFEKDLIDTIKTNQINVENTSIICHFRISTQGGVNAPICHPYPICDDYAEMRKLTNECDIALAHNGVIALTSESDYSGGHYDYAKKQRVQGTRRQLEYNDTMTFIKDYASLIIGKDLYFGRNKSKVQLLKNLIGYSKLAIMNKKGFVTLVGDFYNRNGVYYSNMHAFPRSDEMLLNYMTDKERY